MSDNESKVQDVLGLKAYGETAKVIAQGAVDGAAAVLSRICNPVAEEFGLLLRDQVSKWRPVSEWRFKNMIRQIEMTERLLKLTSDYEERKALPRLVHLTLEQGSWVDAEEVRETWAGLLASSCTKDGKDESNLFFINLLSQLTTSEVKILNHVCENADKVANTIGVVKAYTIELTKDELTEVAGVVDVYRIDRELDHLNALDLIKGSFGSKAESEDDYKHEDEDWGEEKSWEDTIIEIPDLTVANIAPTALGINLYVRCQGSLLPPVEFFKLPH